MDIWRVIFMEPLYNLLVTFYNYIPGHSLGIAIIALTLVTRFALLPFSIKATKSQLAIKEMQPELDKLKEQYKDDKEGLNKAMLGFYKTNKINPLSSCLPLLIQIPIMIALYQVFISGIAEIKADWLYSWVVNPGKMDPTLFGLIDLSKPEKFVLPFVAGALQFVQSWMLMPKKSKEERKEENAMSGMSRQMMYIMPVMTIFISFSLPAALPLYWIVVTLFTIIQQKFTKVAPKAKVTVKKREE